MANAVSKELAYAIAALNGSAASKFTAYAVFQLPLTLSKANAYVAYGPPATVKIVKTTAYVAYGPASTGDTKKKRRIVNIIGV